MMPGLNSFGERERAEYRKTRCFVFSYGENAQDGSAGMGAPYEKKAGAYIVACVRAYIKTMD